MSTQAALTARSAIKKLRPQFDALYDKYVINAGLYEVDNYYVVERERYWRSLELFCSLDVPAPARILEIGGGQIAILCKHLFGDSCVVGDISKDYAAPVERAGVEHIIFNLLDPKMDGSQPKFDVIVLLEVIEHIPVPAHVILEKLKSFLTPSGVIFLTTPNLFRLRNLARMAAGIDYLDLFMVPEPGQGLGHQLEYTASHLRWQIKRAGLEELMLVHDRLGGRVGHSLATRVARRLIAPLELRPKWRDGLVAAVRNSPPKVN